MDEKPDKKRIPLKDWLTLISIFLISLVGFLVIIYATRWGPWVFSDSTEYIVSAKNLLAGHGLGLYGPSGAFHPLSLHPPFYSLLLGFFGLFGADLLVTARWLDAILFGLTIMLVGVSLYMITKSSWLSIGASFLLLSMPALVDIYSGAMSEPLFIFTGLVGIFLILCFIKNERYILLISAALFSGLSLLTRYAGFAFIITGIFALLVFNQKPWKKRITHSLIYGTISILPIIGWRIWLKVLSISSQQFGIGVNPMELFTRFRLSVMEIIWSWLPFTSVLPQYSYNLARNLLLILLILMLILFALAARMRHKNNQKLFDSNNGLMFAVLMFVFVLAYLLILAFSYIFTHPTPDLVARTLLPAHIAVLLCFFSLLLFFIRAWSSIKPLILIPIILIIGVSISYVHDSVDIISNYHQSGFGYTSRSWRESETLHTIEKLPSDIPLISNESAAVLFYTGRPTYDISELINNAPQILTNRFGDDLTDPVQNEFRNNGAALVLFNTYNWQFYQLYGDQTAERMQNLTKGLYLYSQLKDGAIYMYNPPEE
jgi:Dolichyl-phosphate-mannose-protein mannosyltransferase